MSDYNGPFEYCHVRVLRDWETHKGIVPAGTISQATWYPELGTHYVDKLHQSVGNHPAHIGLIEEIEDGNDA